MKHGRTRPAGSDVSSLAAVACALLASAWAGLGLAACSPAGDKLWGEPCRNIGLGDDCADRVDQRLFCIPVSCDGVSPFEDRCTMIPERQDDGTTVCQNPAAVCGSFAPPSFGVDCLPAELCGVTPNPVCPAEDPGEADTAGPDTAAGTGSETTAETTADTTAASIPETTAPVLPGAQPPSAEAMVSSAGSAITP